MKITGIDILVAGAGWRNFNFLKISTDEGLTGWSDFSEGNVGGIIAPLIRMMGQHLIGRDPRKVVPLMEETRKRSYGVAIGAAARAQGPIENALIDIKAKSLGVPVYDMLGGAIRDPIRLYWSHCGSYHVTIFGRHRQTGPPSEGRGLPRAEMQPDHVRPGHALSVWTRLGRRQW